MINISSPAILPKIFPSLTWSVKELKGKPVFLTFDDGPMEVITPWVLDLLAQYDVKATFFLLGKNVEQYPEIFQLIKDDGHAVGNHTYNHLRGWTTPNAIYYESVEKADAVIQSRLFRPPYGMIKPSQVRHLKKKYDIVMWNVLTHDYDKSLPCEQCFSYVEKYTEPGSIIVFHDSFKAEKNLREVLPKTLDFLKREGYSFQNLDAVLKS